MDLIELLVKYGATKCNINLLNDRGSPPFFACGYYTFTKQHILDTLNVFYKLGDRTDIITPHGYALLHAYVCGCNDGTMRYISDYPHVKCFECESISLFQTIIKKLLNGM